MRAAALRLGASCLAALAFAANAASPLRLDCSHEQASEGGALICEYAMLGRQNEKLAQLHERLAEIGKAGELDIAAWLAERDACADVPCLDHFFDARIVQAMAVVETPTAPATAELVLPPAPKAAPAPVSKSVQAPLPEPLPAAVEIATWEAEPVAQPVVAQVEPEALIQRVAPRPRAEVYLPRRGLDWLLGRPGGETASYESEGLEFELLAGAAVVATLCLVMLIMLRGSLTRCPKCEKWFAEEEGERETVGEWTEYRTIPGSEKHVSVAMRMDDVAYRCRHCGYEWHTREALRA